MYYIVGRRHQAVRRAAATKLVAQNVDVATGSMYAVVQPKLYTPKLLLMY